MYKLLIAEDELWLRKRLVSTIDWKACGIGRVYEAEDGAEALRVALEEEPDILITDIRMPELSGIDLMKVLNESSVFPRTVVVSGYDEFQYAQQALKQGAVNYLLKPVEEKELLETVVKCVAELEEEKRNKTLLNKSLEASKLLMENIYEELLFDNIGTNKKYVSILEKMENSFPAESAALVLVRAKNQFFLPDEENEADVMIAYNYVENAFKDALSRLGKDRYSYRKENLIILLLFFDGGEEVEEKMQSCLEDAVEQLKGIVPFQLFYQSSHIVHEFSGLRSSYEALRNDMERICDSGRQGNLSEAGEDTANFEDVYTEYNFTELINGIRSGEEKRAEKELRKLLQASSKHLESSGAFFQQLFYLHLLNFIASVCFPECEAAAGKLAGACMDCMAELGSRKSRKSFYKIQEKLEELVRQASRVYGETSGKRRHWIIDQALKYVEENYSTALSTRDVAERFFMNASYFSKLFHEQIGVTFSNYLIRIRIKKAKTMLSQTNMKLQEIAYAVGYTNVQYFSTVFKEKEGVSPSKYRQLRTPAKEQGEDGREGL